MSMATITATRFEATFSHPVSRLRAAGLGAKVDALEEWFRFHGIDPTYVLCGWPVVRDEAARCVRYVTVAEHAPQGARIRTVDLALDLVEVTEQGEAPPLPFPEILLDAQEGAQ